MNSRQRIVLFAGILLIALMVTFPPMKGWGKGYGLFPGGCTYLAALDKKEIKVFGTWQTTWQTDNGWRCWRFDPRKLTFQIVIAALLTGGFFVLLGGKRA